MQTIVEFKKASCVYADGPAVLRDVNLHIHPGQFIGLIGPSGSGKTTLMRSMLGLVPLCNGTVEVLGKPVIPGAPVVGIGYIPQLEMIDWTFPVTVEEVVLMGRATGSNRLPWPSGDERRAVAAVLSRLGIEDLAQRHIRDLSGGQQQRVFLARALIGEPKLLLLDEPVSGVDIKTRDDILHMLSDLNADGVSIIMTCHELNAVAAHLPWVICLNRTVLAEGPPDEVFTSSVLSETYGANIRVVRQDGVTLIGDIPHSAGEEERRRSRIADVKRTHHAGH